MTEFVATPAPIPSGAEEVQEEVHEQTVEDVKPHFTPTAFASPVMPEAGGICWTEMHGVKIGADGSTQTFKINVTGRGRSSKEAFANLVELITDGKMSPEEFRTATKLSLFQFVAPSTKAPEVKVLANIANPIVTPPAIQQAQALGGTVSGGVLNIVKLDISPRADGKCDLKFYGNDKAQPKNKYPDLTWVTTADYAIDKLKTVAGFSGEHFAMVGSYDLKCKLVWVASEKLNRNGAPYKNVERFEAV